MVYNGKSHEKWCFIMIIMESPMKNGDFPNSVELPEGICTVNGCTRFNYSTQAVVLILDYSLYRSLVLMKP